MDHGGRRLLAGSALVCATLIYVYPLALPTPLLDPDEGLHAAISQQMVESGDYLTPRFLGKPFLDKPILYFAAQAASLRAWGMHEAAVRTPGMMFALLGAATTGLLARRMFDATTGWLALLVALTSVIPASLAQAAAHDVALVPWLNLLLLCLWEADRECRADRRVALTAGAAVMVALAVLTKGLIGIAVIGVGYTLYCLLARRLTVALCVRGILILAGGWLLASPWSLTMETRAPGYLHYYFVERHLGGYTTSAQQHGHAPWHFYLPLLLAGTIPWCVYLAPGLYQSWIGRRRSSENDARATLFTLCWLLGGLAFLSVAHSKLVTYSLPLYPAIAILAGHAWKRFLTGELSPTLDKIFAALFSLCCVVGCLVPPALVAGFDRYNQLSSSAAAYVVAGLATAAMVAALVLFYRQRRTAALATGSLVFALLFVAVMTWPMQPLAERHSQRQLAQAMAQLPKLPDRIVFGGSRVASFVFYLSPGQRSQLGTDQIVEVESSVAHTWPNIPAGTIIVVTSDAWAEWPNQDFRQAVRVRAVTEEYCLVEPAAEAPSVARQPGATAW